MTSLKILGVAVLLTAVIATQAFAQAAVQEPGEFAFYHPNSDVLNAGRGVPPADAFAYTPERDVTRAQLSVPHHAHRAVRAR